MYAVRNGIVKESSRQLLPPMREDALTEMCGWGIIGRAIAAQLHFTREFCCVACRLLVTFPAISARLRRERFHGNVRIGA
jgi:hypothetical protein